MSDAPETQHVHHTLEVRRQCGAMRLDVALRLHAPWTTLFGPSGSGKSSLLRAACGLLGRSGIRFTRESAPQVVLQDAKRYTPPQQRQIGWAPQSPCLFPHLTVRENLLFAGGEDFKPIVELFRLEPLLAQRPAQLSGGEQQRVNLARSMTSPGCRLLLLDEPFTGMDRDLRNALLPDLVQYVASRSIQVVSVTHDLEEVFRLAPWVIRVRHGSVEQEGPHLQTLHSERSQLLSTFT